MTNKRKMLLLGIMDKEIKKMLGEDCMEVLGYLEAHSIQGREKIFHTIETQEGLDSLENLILQLSRIFGAFAFKNTDNIHLFKIRVGHIYRAYPEFKIVAPVYLKEVKVADINVGLSESDAKEQQEKMIIFLESL